MTESLHSYDGDKDTSSNVYYDGAVYYMRAQTFEFTRDVILSYTIIRCYRGGSATAGTVTVYVLATDDDGKPTGSALASGSFDLMTLTTDTDGESKQVNFTTEARLSKDTTYAIVIANTGLNAVNAVYINNDTSTAYDDGYYYTADSTSPPDDDQVAWALAAGSRSISVFAFWGVYDTADFIKPRPYLYDETLAWDEEAGTWTATPTGGGRYVQQLIAVGQNASGQGVIYFGSV